MLGLKLIQVINQIGTVDNLMLSTGMSLMISYTIPMG